MFKPLIKLILLLGLLKGVALAIASGPILFSQLPVTGQKGGDSYTITDSPFNTNGSVIPNGGGPYQIDVEWNSTTSQWIAISNAYGYHVGNCSGDISSGCNKVQGMHFGTTSIPTGPTPPAVGQLIGYDGIQLRGMNPGGGGGGLPTIPPTGGQFLLENTVIAVWAALTGDISCSATTLGLCTIIQINGAPIPVSAGALATNSSGQLVAVTLPWTSTNGGSGLVNPAPHSLLISEGLNAYHLLTAAVAGDLIFDLGAGLDFSEAPMSGDCVITSLGVITCTKTNGTTLGTFATQNVPTGASQCLQASVAGVVSGTGLACGSGGGGNPIFTHVITESAGATTLVVNSGSVATIDGEYITANANDTSTFPSTMTDGEMIQVDFYTPNAFFTQSWATGSLVQQFITDVIGDQNVNVGGVTTTPGTAPQCIPQSGGHTWYLWRFSSSANSPDGKNEETLLGCGSTPVGRTLPSSLFPLSFTSTSVDANGDLSINTNSKFPVAMAAEVALSAFQGL